MGAGIRREREAVQAKLRTRCPPHPAELLYTSHSYATGRPRVSCYRCYRTVADGTLAELIEAGEERLNAALRGEYGEAGT